MSLYRVTFCATYCTLAFPVSAAHNRAPVPAAPAAASQQLPAEPQLRRHPAAAAESAPAAVLRCALTFASVLLQLGLLLSLQLAAASAFRLYLKHHFIHESGSTFIVAGELADLFRCSIVRLIPQWYQRLTISCLV